MRRSAIGSPFRSRSIPKVTCDSAVVEEKWPPDFQTRFDSGHRREVVPLLSDTIRGKREYEMIRYSQRCIVPETFRLSTSDLRRLRSQRGLTPYTKPIMLWGLQRATCGESSSRFCTTPLSVSTISKCSAELNPQSICRRLEERDGVIKSAIILQETLTIVMDSSSRGTRFFAIGSTSLQVPRAFDIRGAYGRPRWSQEGLFC